MAERILAIAPLYVEGACNAGLDAFVRLSNQQNFMSVSDAVRLIMETREGRAAWLQYRDWLRSENRSPEIRYWAADVSEILNSYIEDETVAQPVAEPTVVVPQHAPLPKDARPMRVSAPKDRYPHTMSTARKVLADFTRRIDAIDAQIADLQRERAMLQEMGRVASAIAEEYVK